MTIATDGGPLTDRSSIWRARWRVARLLWLLATHLPLHGLWRLAGRRSPWPTVFLRRAGRAAGAEVRIAGVPLVRDVLIVANHLSWLDILILAGATGARFVAKDEVARWPVFGFLAGLNRTVFIARERRAEVRGQANRLRDALTQRDPVALFAEGGTGDGIRLLPFRASLFAALDPPLPGVRVQPVAIDYAEGALLAWGDTGMATEMMRLLGLPGRRQVTLRFLEPIPLADQGRKAIAATAQVRIAAALRLDDAPASRISAG